MATDGALELQEICPESLDKDDITYPSEEETLNFVSESHEQALTDENGLDLQGTADNSPDIQGVGLHVSHEHQEGVTSINSTASTSTALDTLVNTACQGDTQHTTSNDMSENDTANNGVILDTAIRSTTSAFSGSHHSLESSSIIGTMLDSNMISSVSAAVRGTEVNLSLPTMAFKHISQSSGGNFSSIREYIREPESNDDDVDDDYDETENQDGLRKSGRKRKPARPKSPEEEPKFKRKKKRSNRLPSTGQMQLTEIPFRCDKCGSPYVTNPSRRGNRVKTSNHQPSPRHKIDPVTGKTLTLCNACGLSFDRPKKPHKEKVLPSQEEKTKYLVEAKKFAKTIADQINDTHAERLYCPLFKIRECGCLQKYIKGSDDEKDVTEFKNRVTELLDFMKNAQELSKEKCYDLDQLRNRPAKNKRSKNIGLGNGQRKSQAFEEFVLEKRKYLRDKVKLCERATQKVLFYSNNFLHKKLKTDPGKAIRIERKKGKAALGKLMTFEDLQNEKCCVDNCNTIAQSHLKLLQQWRDRAVSGQTEARRVLAEMLTPSGGARSNCYRFISWVTGCSHSTIGRVNEQMKQTSGDREPPTHGLIKWWKEHPKPKKPRPVKHVAQTIDTVQQVALQQIHQTTMPQVANLLQAAVSSAGLTAVMMPSMQTTVPLGTASTNTLNQPQISTIMLNNNGTIQIQTQGTQQVTTPQVQQIQLQQQQQYEQQIQQLQLQAFQLQQQQQQIQQRLQQTQQQLQQAQQQQQQQQIQQTLQHCLPSQVATLHPGQQQQQIIHTQAQEIQVVQPHQQIVQQDTNQRDVQQDNQQTVANISASNIVTVAIPTSLAVSQSTSLSSESFLSPEVFQLALNQIPQQLVIPVSSNNVTQAVPVSLIQTTQTSL